MNDTEYNCVAVTELTIPIVMDNIGVYVDNHRLNVTYDYGTIVLHNGISYTVELTVNEPATIDHISLRNDTRAIAFTTLAELKGWLRAMRSVYYTS